jgi:hypothetical protein
LDIDGWLRGLGLAQYAEIFRANHIDGELLGRLTNDDLKDIGVASLGHRKKLLEAIAAGEIALLLPEPDVAKAEACWRGSGAIRAGGSRPAIFLLRSTRGSPKASTPAT